MKFSAKKLLSLLLCMCILCSVFVLPVNATSGSETDFNANDQKKLQTAIISLHTPIVEGTALAKVIYTHAFSYNFNIKSTVKEVLDQVFINGYSDEEMSEDTAAEGASTVVINIMNTIVPTLYSHIPENLSTYFKGAPSTSPSSASLLTGDLLLMEKDGASYIYIYDGAYFVKLVKPILVRESADSVFAEALNADRYVVIRPSNELSAIHRSTDNELNLTDAQKAVIGTAEAYLIRGYRIQYDDTTPFTKNAYRWNSGLRTPEESTLENIGFTNCAAFTSEVYKTALGFTDVSYTTGNQIWSSYTVWRYPENTSASIGGETEAQKAQIQEDFYANLQPGDIINIRYEKSKGGGHSMLYVGNGNIIHSGGSNYNFSSGDNKEASIKHMRVEEFFDTTNRRYFFTKLNSVNICRPLKNWNGTIPENTINRITTMKGVVGEKFSSKNRFSTVNPGDEITYTFRVFNSNDETKILEITDIVPENTTYVSGDLVNNDGNLSYSMTVPSYATEEISYTVKVNEGTPDGSWITSNSATIGGVIHKTYEVPVRKTLTQSQQASVSEAIDNNSSLASSTDKGIKYANKIYKDVLSVDAVLAHDDIASIKNLLFPAIDEYTIITGVTASDYIGAYYLDENSHYAKMLVPRMFGGRQLVVEPHKDKIIQKLEHSQFVTGDIILTEAKSGTSTLYMYNDGKVLNLSTGSYVQDADSFLDKIFANNCFAVLRPSMSDTYEYEKTQLEIYIDELKALNTKTITDDEVLAEFETVVANIDAYLTANTTEKLTTTQKLVYDTAKTKINNYKNPPVIVPEEHITAKGKIWFALGGNSKFFVKTDEEAYLNRANYQSFLPGVDFAGYVGSPTGIFSTDQAAITMPAFGGSMFAYTVNVNPKNVGYTTIPDFSLEDDGNYYWTIKGTPYLIRPANNVIKLFKTAPNTKAIKDQAIKDRYASLTSAIIDVPDKKYESLGFIGACVTAYRKFYKVTIYYADGTTDVQVEEISGTHNPNTYSATYKDGQVYLANFLNTTDERDARFGFIPWDIENFDSTKVITQVKFEIDAADTNTTRAGHIVSAWGVPVGGVDEPEAPQPSALDNLVTELEALNNAGIKDDASLNAVEAKVAEIDTYLTNNPAEALTTAQQTIYNTAKAKIKAYKDAQTPDDGGDEPTDDTAIYADGKVWFDLNGNARLFVKSTDDVYVNRATYKDYIPGVDFAGTVQNPTGDFATDQAAVKFPNNGGAMFAYTVDEKPSSLAAGTLPDLTKNGDNYYWTMKGTPYLLRVNEKVIKIAGIGGTFGAGVTEENKAKYQTLRDGTTMDVPDKKYDSLGFLVGTVGAYRKSYEVSVYYQGEETPTSTIITINGTENATNANYTLGTVPLQSFTNTATTTEYRYNFVAKEIPVDSSKVVTAVKFCEDYSHNYNYARSGLIISAWGVEATGTGSAEEATLKALVNELEDINNKGITSEATLLPVEAKIAEIDTLISGNANLALTADQQKIYNRVKSNIKVYKDSVAPAEHITANGKIWFDLKGNSRLFVKSTDEAYTNRKTYQDYLPGVDFAGFLASPTGVFAADQMSVTNLVSITDGSGGGMLVYTENENPASPTLSTPADLKTDAEGNHFFTVNGGTYLVRPDKNVIKVAGTTVSTSALEDANIAARYKTLKAGTTIDVPDKKYTSVGFLTAVRHSYTKYVTVDLYYKGEETPVTVEIKCAPKRGTSAYVKDINFKLFTNTYEDMSSSGHYFTESIFETDPSKVLTAIHVKDNGPSNNVSWPAHIVSAWGVEKVVTIDELITELKDLNSASATDFTALKEKVAEIDEFLAKNSQTASDLTAEQKTAYDEAVNKIANAELSGSIEIAYKADSTPYAKVTINNISELEGKPYKIIIVYIGENDVQQGIKIVDGTSTTSVTNTFDVEIDKVPAGTKSIKGLIWKDFATLLPLAR